MFTFNFTLSNFNKISTRIFTTGILAALGIMGGVIPEVSGRSLSFSAATYAYAQEYTSEEVINYARAGYEVELLRRQIYKEIKTLVNEPPPNIVCNQEQTLNNLPEQVRAIANRYCNQSKQIVQQHNLSINRFNELKAHYDRGTEFYKQVQNILLNLQTP